MFQHLWDYQNFADILVYLFLVVSARVKKTERTIAQQKELHDLQMQREHLQIKALKDEMQRNSARYAIKLDQDREVPYALYANQFLFKFSVICYSSTNYA